MAEIIVIVHNIRSIHNVGSIFRTAEGFGVQKIILSGYTPYPRIENDTRLPHIADKLTAQIHKTALGATETVAWEHHEDVLEVITKLKKDNVTTLAIEQVESAVFLQNFKVEKNKKYALVFGNEVYGVSQDAVALCDGCIEIPQLGTKHSLNISVSAGIVVWDLFKQFND